MADQPSYDAFLLVSFGGPEGPDDVLPFLENVLRGRKVPRERLLEVAGHYDHFGGRSPINDQNRALIEALSAEFNAHGITLPVYWGNRNWHPLLVDTVTQMQRAGVRRALAFVTSAFTSYSGCRQYLENIEAARAEVGPGAPEIDKLRTFYNHPGFIEAMVDRTRAALESVDAARRSAAVLLFTAHSIPTAMAGGTAYERQFNEASRLVTEALNHSHWRTVYQSRSGPPSQSWLGPDICDALRQLRGSAVDAVVIPIGFVSDHMEVLYDLDTEAAAVACELGIHMVRAGTAGTHPRFVRMVRELVAERLDPSAPRQAVGEFGPGHDVCLPDCCR